MTDERAAAPVRVLMVAIGGYGYHYLQALLDEVPAARCHAGGRRGPVRDGSRRVGPRCDLLGVPVRRRRSRRSSQPATART